MWLMLNEDIIITQLQILFGVKYHIVNHRSGQFLHAHFTAEIKLFIRTQILHTNSCKKL